MTFVSYTSTSIEQSGSLLHEQMGSHHQTLGPAVRPAFVVRRQRRCLRVQLGRLCRCRAHPRRRTPATSDRYRQKRHWSPASTSIRSDHTRPHVTTSLIATFQWNLRISFATKRGGTGACLPGSPRRNAHLTARRGAGETSGAATMRAGRFGRCAPPRQLQASRPPTQTSVHQIAVIPDALRPPYIHETRP